MRQNLGQTRDKPERRRRSVPLGTLSHFNFRFNDSGDVRGVTPSQGRSATPSVSVGPDFGRVGLERIYVDHPTEDYGNSSGRPRLRMHPGQRWSRVGRTLSNSPASLLRRLSAANRDSRARASARCSAGCVRLVDLRQDGAVRCTWRPRVRNRRPLFVEQ